MALVGRMHDAGLLHPRGRDCSRTSIHIRGPACVCSGGHGRGGTHAIARVTTLYPEHTVARVGSGHCSGTARRHDYSVYCHGSDRPADLSHVRRFDGHDRPFCRTARPRVCERNRARSGDRICAMAGPASPSSGGSPVDTDYRSSYGHKFGCILALGINCWLRDAHSPAADDDCNWSHSRGYYGHRARLAITKAPEYSVARR